MKRVGLIALLHESNTFLDVPTTLEHFQSNLLVSGRDVLEAFRGTPHEAGGMIAAVEADPDIELIGIFAARAMPYGTITSECWSTLTRQLETALQSTLPLDGLLVAPHGATVAENAPDADGDWLQRVRAIVGPDVPIVGTLDLHANVSPRMVDACQALIGYRTNPHLDQHARGLDAGTLMSRTLRGEVWPVTSLVQLPLCVNIERQATSEQHGQVLWAEADRLQQQTGMLCVSCLYGFPYSDVAEMGATVVAVADRSKQLPSQTATEMAGFWWSMRREFDGQLVCLNEAVRIANEVRQKEPSRPVGLLEMGDNVGGGSPGDGTWIVHEWLAHGEGRILTVIYDPDVVSKAVASGLNCQTNVSIGGKSDPDRHGSPIVGTFRVRHLSDGRFSESEVRHGGYSKFDQGPTAVLESASVTVIVTSRRVAPMSLQQLLSQHIQPSEFAAIVIKGVHAPVAAYGPVCSRLIRVNTRGATSADLAEFQFHHRRIPMEPFERIESWTP